MTKEREDLLLHRMQREVFAMKLYYVTFRSVTHGQRAERILREAGIRSTLQRTPRWMEVRGCGYSLLVWTEGIGKSTDLLVRSGVPMQKVYIQTEAGNLEELQL